MWQEVARPGRVTHPEPCSVWRGRGCSFSGICAANDPGCQMGTPSIWRWLYPPLPPLSQAASPLARGAAECLVGPIFRRLLPNPLLAVWDRDRVACPRRERSERHFPLPYPLGDQESRAGKRVPSAHGTFAPWVAENGWGPSNRPRAAGPPRGKLIAVHSAPATRQIAAGRAPRVQTSRRRGPGRLAARPTRGGWGQSLPARWHTICQASQCVQTSPRHLRTVRN